MKKATLFILLTSSLQLTAITSNMTHRVMSSSPLLYKMIDYSKQQASYEGEPIFSSMYDAQHTIANLTPGSKQTLTLDQQGTGDLNPFWINLISNNSLANYNSQVTFTPKLQEFGVLLHWYNQFEKAFIDVKTALIQCKSEIKIDEVGGGNGLNTGILNAQQAFTQDSWNYGKIGESNQVTGLDNIELRVGGYTEISNESAYDIFFSGFGIVEAPTGSGTKAEWLFEPQIGTNHWGIGLGAETLFTNDNGLKVMVAGNYRYLAPAFETRSFDLTDNGAWSRYLLLQYNYDLPNSPVAGVSGINYLTRSAYIKGRNEVNAYARLQKECSCCSFELSYNYLYVQQETVGSIANLATDYGIYTLTGSSGGGGGATTSSTATINQSTTASDELFTTPVLLTTSMLDKASAQAGSYSTSSITARIEKTHEDFVYGLGANIEIAQSASALSTWAVWAKFELLFDN